MAEDHQPATRAPDRCAHGLTAGLRPDGKPACTLCRRTGTTPPPPNPDPDRHDLDARLDRARARNVIHLRRPRTA